MKFIAAQPMKQVHLQMDQSSPVPVTFDLRNKALYEDEHEMLQNRILQLCPSHVWPKGSHELACPRPILIAEQHQEKLAQLNASLFKAITDVVERWWTDANAKFPARMPLDCEEEELLRVGSPLPQSSYRRRVVFLG